MPAEEGRCVGTEALGLRHRHQVLYAEPVLHDARADDVPELVDNANFEDASKD